VGVIRSDHLIRREQMIKCTKGQVRRLKTALRWKIPAEQRQRIQMVLLRESGMTQPLIAAAMGVSLSTVNRAHMAYDHGGIEALKPRPSGGRKRENMTLEDEKARVVMVESVREIGERIERETRFYITSLLLLASVLGPLVRDHWAVENSLHWVMDMVFRDDECRVRKDHAPAKLHHDKTHGEQPDEKRHRKRLHAPEAQSRRMGRRLPRTPHLEIGLKQVFPALAKENSEIVARDMDEVSLVDVFPATQPRAAHAAALQNMREAALHNLAAFAHGLLADARSQPVTVCIDRRASLVVAMPTQIAFTRPGLGDARLPWAVAEVFQHIA
jgi:predicted transposase YbfD/YdcC